MKPTFEAFLYSLLIFLFIGLVGLFSYSIHSYVEETNKKKEDQDQNKVNWSLAGIIITGCILLASLFYAVFFIIKKRMSIKAPPEKKFIKDVEKLKKRFATKNENIMPYDTPLKDEKDYEYSPRSTEKIPLLSFEEEE